MNIKSHFAWWPRKINSRWYWLCKVQYIEKIALLKRGMTITRRYVDIFDIIGIVGCRDDYGT